MDRKSEIARLKKEIAEKTEQLKELEDVYFRSGCVIFEQTEHWFNIRARRIDAADSQRYDRFSKIITAKTKEQVVGAIDDLIDSLAEIKQRVSEDDAIVSRLP